MKRLIDSANVYIEKSTWKDLALVKLCLCSLGLMAGAVLPKKAKKPVIFGAMVVFVATYVPLMTKFMRIFATMPKPARKPMGTGARYGLDDDYDDEDWD